MNLLYQYSSVSQSSQLLANYNTNKPSMAQCCCDRDDMEKISKGWSIAMFYSKERLRRVYELDDAQLGAAVKEGKLVLETLCLFVHACIKRGQYRYEFVSNMVHEKTVLLIQSLACRRNFGVSCTLNMASWSTRRR